MKKIWLHHLMNLAKRIANRRKSFNARMDKALAKVHAAMKIRGCTRYLNWREESIKDRRKYHNAKVDAKLAIINHSMALIDDIDWKKSAKRALRLADKAIDSYDDALLLDESNRVYGWCTTIGKIGWTLALAVVELILWLCAMMLLSSAGVEITMLIGIVSMLAIVIPLDIMFSNSLLFKPFVLFRKLQLRVVRDRMVEIAT